MSWSDPRGPACAIRWGELYRRDRDVRVLIAFHCARGDERYVWFASDALIGTWVSAPTLGVDPALALTTMASLATRYVYMEKTARVLVTGGSGMVGRALIGRLRRDGYENIFAPSSKQLDLRDQAAVQEFFRDNPIDFVFHLAGHIGGIGASVSNPVEFLHENLMIATHVIHAARVADVTKLLFLGSSCVYPRDCPQPMKESDILTGPFEPTNEGYAIAKIAGMKLCEYSNQQYGTNFVNLMPCNLYGYGDHFEPSRSHVVSALIHKFHEAKQKPLPFVEVWGTGTTRRELLFVEDLIEAMLHFMKNVDAEDVGAFVNIGLGQDIAIGDLARMIKDIAGYSGDIVFNADKPDGMPRKLMDVSRATRLGWKARISIPQGVKLTYDWYLKNIDVRVGIE
jgi:GDP-L-fucose synthase